MAEKPKNKLLSRDEIESSIDVNFIRFGTDFLGGLTGLLFLIVTIVGAGLLLRYESLNPAVDPTFISDSMTAGDCSATIFYNPQRENNVVFAIDCTHEVRAYYYLQLSSWVYYDYGTVPGAIRADYYSSGVYHVLVSTMITPETEVVTLTFEPVEGEPLFVSIEVR